MINLRKLIRLLLKIPATPFIFVFCIFMSIALVITQFFQWVYVAEEFDKAEVRQMMETNIDFLKRWFTTI